jgi:DNA polymerase-3 subunit alpha
MYHTQFVHLHLHSQFSLLESTIRVDSLMKRLKELQMPAVALTDKYNLFGAIPFYQQCHLHGVKPILGCEVWVTTGSRLDRSQASGRPDNAYPLILLAENEDGYKNLMQLSSAGYLQGYTQGPRVDRDVLARHAKGLIALSGGEEGEIDRFLLKEEAPVALKTANLYQEIFGKDHFFLELTDHHKPEQKRVLKALMDIAEKTGIPVVATNDVHYLRPEDAPNHEVLLALGKGEVISSPTRPVMGSDEFYLKSAAEMLKLFGEVPQALQQTLEISSRCNVTLEFGQSRMPSFPMKDKAMTEHAYLEKLCLDGLEKRFGTHAYDPQIKGRMIDELGIIQKTGFSGYFLIVWDVITNARKMGIPVGPGRGSAAGSLVSYLIGITDVDPIKYDLLFERFINPERVSAPDIDVDVCDTRRDEVLKYITQAYGKDRVASIVTFGTMAAKAVIRDVGRVLEIPLPEIDRIAKLIPFEPKITLQDVQDRVPELKALATEEGPLRKLWDVSRALEGLVRHISTHAAGVIIGNEPLLLSVPLCRGTGDEVLTQYDMNALKDVGLLKLDILGLRTLTVIDETLKRVEHTRNTKVDLSTIPLDDPETFKLLKEAKTLGVFQLESRGMRDYMRKLEPEHIEDLIALNALYRPGPLGSDMVDDFIHRKKKLVKVEYMHPKLEPILKTTYGVIVYQEQVMRIAKDLSGFSLGQADLLRKAMGSKNPDKMDQMRGKFIDGAKGVPPDVAEAIFNHMAKFAGYGFNKSHSAAYALVAYQTAYLKAHFAPEFMAALLTSETGNQDKVSQYIFECRRMGVKVLPPDVNESDEEFRVTQDGAIRFSLSAIKNVGTPAVTSIVASRKADGPFTSIFDFCKRIDLKAFTPRMVECLILAGAFDFTKVGRATLKAAVEKIFHQAQGIQSDSQRGQTSLFEMMPSQSSEELPQVAEFSPAQALMSEKEVLGFYISGHPLSEHEWELEHYVTPLHELEEMNDGAEVRVGGLIRSFSQNQSKKTKETFGRFVLEDLHTHVEVIAWPEVYRKYQDILGKDKLVALRGRVDNSGNRLQVIANEVIDMNDMAVKWAKEVHIDVNVVGLDDTLMPKVKKLCEKFPGKAHVFFHMQTAHHGLMVLEAGDGLKVRPSKGFLREIYDLLGEDSIEIKI